jgi:outer membrane protein TolC
MTRRTGYGFGDSIDENEMRSLLPLIYLCGFTALASLVGCRAVDDISTSFPSTMGDVPAHGETYLDIHDPIIEEDYVEGDSFSPDQMLDYQNIQYMPMTLDECIRRALVDSKVFRDLGGTVVSTPSAANTTLDPALVYSNPAFGEDAALSAFDAEYSQSVIFEKNDRPFNTSFTGDTNGLFLQDLGEFNFAMTKLSATGTRFTSRGIINYDDNNQAGNRFFHSWETIVESEFRHPLLQGSGALFNRIAGPSQVPGSFNGILIARTNSEISLADFQSSVRDFVVNVENSYWDLYYAYRELNAQTDARDAAYEVYKNAEADAEAERVSTLEKASAYEQYLRFETALVESLEGRPTEGTQANSGSSGGVFRRNVGVRVAERRLRYLIGMAITDGALLQPSDQPNTTPVVFDWQESLYAANENRPEMRRQRWLVKQRELQLTASKNFLLPRLDVIGRHRFRGLGRDLTGGEPFAAVIESGNNNDNVSSAFADIGSGNFQEWQLGLELRMPVGFRQANVGVRNAQLGVQRERIVLKEQKRKILLDLSNAVAEVRRSSSALTVAEQRYNAAVEYRAQAAERIKNGRAQFDVLLEAQRRVLESQVQFINAEVEHNVAIRNVHFERGTLLNYHGVALSENESDPQAYVSASRRQGLRNGEMDYVMKNPAIAQAANQNTAAAVVAMDGVPVEMSQSANPLFPIQAEPVYQDQTYGVPDEQMISEPVSVPGEFGFPAPPMQHQPMQGAPNAPAQLQPIEGQPIVYVAENLGDDYQANSNAAFADVLTTGAATNQPAPAATPVNGRLVPIGSEPNKPPVHQGSGVFESMGNTMTAPAQAILSDGSMPLSAGRPATEKLSDFSQPAPQPLGFEKMSDQSFHSPATTGQNISSKLTDNPQGKPVSALVPLLPIPATTEK